MNFLVRLRSGPQHHPRARVRPALAALEQGRDLDGAYSASIRCRSVVDTGFPVAVAPALAVLVLGGFLMFVTDSDPTRGRAEHEESFAEVAAVSAPPNAAVVASETERLTEALASRDVPKIRELIAALGAVDPNDQDRLQLGYGVIADCIEEPGATSLARAKAFDANELDSSLRGLVRDLCFDDDGVRPIDSAAPAQAAE
jgi:hypothetical protein